MSVYELALRYYPRLWDSARLAALAAAGRLTEAELQAIKDVKTDRKDDAG